MSEYDSAFQDEIIRELGCKPCGEVTAIRDLKSRMKELEDKLTFKPFKSGIPLCPYCSQAMIKVDPEEARVLWNARLEYWRGNPPDDDD